MIATLSMVQAWDPIHYSMWGVWNFVCWTISAEAFFYLCFPWIQLRLEGMSRRTLLILCIGLLAIIVKLNLSAFVLGYGSRVWWLDIFPRPILRLPEFIVGMTRGSYFVRCVKKPHGESSQVLFIAPGVWTYSAFVMMVGLMCRDSGHWTSLVTVTFAALIFGLAAEETWFSRFLSHKMLLLGGSISYSVYLMQNPVKELVKMLAEAVHVESASIRMIMMAVLLICVSYGAFRLIEVPARDRLRAIFARLEAKQVSTRVSR